MRGGGEGQRIGEFDERRTKGGRQGQIEVENRGTQLDWASASPITQQKRRGNRRKLESQGSFDIDPKCRHSIEMSALGTSPDLD